MNQKQKTIALITVALFVWGYAAMEWSNYLGNDNTTASVTPVSETHYPTNFFKISETYQPEYNYSDPFLKTTEKNYSGPSEQNANDHNSLPKNLFANKPKVEPIPILDETPLEYKGLITSNNKQKFALIIHGTTSHIVKEGDIVNGMLIQSFNEKSMSIKKGSSSEVLIKK